MNLLIYIVIPSDRFTGSWVVLEITTMHSALSFIQSRRARGFAGAAVLLASAPLASAQDKGTLDLLLKKGTITQQEYDSVAKTTAPVNVTSGNSLVKGLKLEGRIHLQYDWLTTEDNLAGAANPPATNQFFIRRTFLGVTANLGNGWSGVLSMDFASGAGAPGALQAGGGTNNTRNLFNQVTISKDVDTYGRFTAGYQKVPFVLEENTSSANIKAVERSIATNYFTGAYTALTNGRLGYGNRRTGLYWDGKLDELPGFTYGAAITNGIQSSTSYGAIGGFNKFAGWGYVAYADNATPDFAYKAGINLGYSGEGNSNPGPGATPLTASASNSVWGYNPYVTLTYKKNAEITAEFIQAQVKNGRFNSVTGLSDANPYGFTITPSYKINDEWEIVARYSYLNTNGRGVQIGQVMRNANNVIPAVAGTTPQFNDARSVYLGFNWYIIGNALKLTAGYEWTEFTGRGTTATAGPTAGNDRFTGAHANVNGFRTRLQLLF